MTHVPGTPSPPADPPVTPPPAPPAPATPPPPPAGQPAPEENDPVALRSALATERASRTAAENAAKAHKTELDKLKASTMTEQEKAVAAARAEGATTASASFNRRMFSADVRLAVAGRVHDTSLFVDPDVSLHLLGFTEVPLTAAGEVDTALIKKSVEEFLKAKPYLLTTGTPQVTPPTKFGSGDNGPKGGGAEPDIENMSMEDYNKWKLEHDPRMRRRHLTSAP